MCSSIVICRLPRIKVNDLHGCMIRQDRSDNKFLCVICFLSIKNEFNFLRHLVIIKLLLAEEDICQSI